MSAHRVHHDLYRGPKLLPDPGDGGTIHVDKDLQICEMVTAAAETRTLARPTKPGIRFALRLKTDGGDAVVTATGGFNVAGETIATFADASDFLSLISVTVSGTTYRWEILEGNVATVIHSATPSHTVSHTVSHTPSHTVSHTVSHTPSHTASHTVSHTASATA